MREIIGQGFNILLYCLLFAGIAVIFEKSIRTTIGITRARRRLKMRRGSAKPLPRILRHLDLLVKTTASGKLGWEALAAAVSIIFAASFWVGMGNYAAVTAMLISIALACMPYILLRIKLESRRRKGSFEGEAFVAALLSKYRISNCNIYGAMDILAKDDSTPKLCREILIPIVLRMRSTGDREQLFKIAEDFSFAINTNWSRMVAYNIGFAAATGGNVTESIEDILVQLRDARALSETRKRLNSESTKMTVLMVPGAYIFTVFMSVKYVGITWKSFIYNQFFTPQGFSLFVAALLLFLINFVLVELANNRRFDY